MDGKSRVSTEATPQGLKFCEPIVSFSIVPALAWRCGLVLRGGRERSGMSETSAEDGVLLEGRFANWEAEFIRL